MIKSHSFLPLATIPTIVNPHIKSLTGISIRFFEHDPSVLSTTWTNAAFYMTIANLFLRNQQIFCQKIASISFKNKMAEMVKTYFTMDLIFQKKRENLLIEDGRLAKMNVDQKKLDQNHFLLNIQRTMFTLIRKLFDCHLKSYKIKENSVEILFSRSRKIKFPSHFLLEIPKKIIFRISYNMLTFDHNFCPTFNQLKWHFVKLHNDESFKIMYGQNLSKSIYPIKKFFNNIAEAENNSF